jgi:hypothetical protein
MMPEIMTPHIIPPAILLMDCPIWKVPFPMENGAIANCRINEPRINIAKATRMRSKFIGKAYSKLECLLD